MFWRIPDCASGAGRGVADAAAGVAVSVEGILNIVLFFKMRSVHGSSWMLLDGIITLLWEG